ncbi:dolichyl-diphosphooligosaccharide--protein glycosyltransferase subunit 4A-like [Pyrus ussuriensis x Pyrus communis]|uniref:Dolichyl-diphosphooligosaccharide--protein glycosyltransferase subunit 4A-like n=1 Tax=Pyrus ussuriensis x Pyrus communis TaxID=2448454 RepID=A0A5N5EZA3_9ROSA|nr:dolichyl-diphosphooligosaccharide--protein glycosyltransferase subunit 4A-like [Pyrus ussuriensis x Pyrus communis]
MPKSCIPTHTHTFMTLRLYFWRTNSSSSIFPQLTTLNFELDAMIDDVGLGTVANLLGMFIFFLVIAYHYVTADPKYEGN